jgi:hypothetical protein
MLSLEEKIMNLQCIYNIYSFVRKYPTIVILLIPSAAFLENKSGFRAHALYGEKPDFFLIERKGSLIKTECQSKFIGIRQLIDHHPCG